MEECRWNTIQACMLLPHNVNNLALTLSWCCFVDIVLVAMWSPPWLRGNPGLIWTLTRPLHCKPDPKMNLSRPSNHPWMYRRAWFGLNKHAFNFFCIFLKPYDEVIYYTTWHRGLSEPIMPNDVGSSSGLGLKTELLHDFFQLITVRVAGLTVNSGRC